MPKKRRYQPIPPPPGDAANYIWIQTKEKGFWRRKRGTVKPAPVNAAFKKNNELAAITSPAAKRILGKLDEFVKEMETGRFIANVSGKLMKAWHKTGRFDYSLLKGYEMQPARPLGELAYIPSAFVNKGEVVVDFIVRDGTVNKLMKSITGFYFELIMLYGDPTKTNSLRVLTDTSDKYLFDELKESRCRLSITLPTKKGPWMALLKVSCMQGEKTAYGPRHNGMKVVEVGWV